ncbi:MAG: DUF4861 domain-containing protein [Chloroflexia bacterium]|nr:DUF4861 domain-containing protein [Chloroflexia bacterium]
MKKLFLVLSIAFTALLACNQSSNEESTGKDTDTLKVTTAKAYAEISIAQGGEWKERVYEGGTSFKNVEELWVPQSHTDHSWYIRYEGPGWESNKVGYRLYLDWRNAIDIFGKLTDSIVLPQVGLDGFDSYHKMSPWGVDILKVGKGLGIGSIGRLVDDSVLHFTDVDSTFVSIENLKEKSTVKVDYYGWKTSNEKIDLNSELSIVPDKRYTKHTIKASKAVPGICTGIVNHKVEVLKGESENKEWAYLATYGAQTLVSEIDKLGMAILYRVTDVENRFEGKFDHLLTFKPTTEPVSFYFLGAWEQENGGIKTREEFISYLNGLLKELNSNDKI